MENDFLLNGWDPTPGIVAVECLEESGQVVVFRRREDGSLITAKETFHPFFLLTDARYLEGCPEVLRVEELAGGGDNHYNFLVHCSHGPAWRRAQQYAQRQFVKACEAGARTWDTKLRSEDILLAPAEFSTQYLLESGRTLFKGMHYEDLHRLQLDLETYTSKMENGHRYYFAQPHRPGDRIIVISLRDNRGWEEVLTAQDYPDERDMLRAFGELIQERDPDVIEVYNCEFDLGYLAARARRWRVPLLLGREGEGRRREMTCRPRRQTRGRYVPLRHAAEYSIFGRQVIDLLLAVIKFDQRMRILESRRLKEVAEQLGFNIDRERTFIPGERISEVWDENPAQVIRYCRDDAQDVDSLSRYLMDTDFALTQMAPLTYQKEYRCGMATMINLFLLRAYLHAHQAVPLPEWVRRVRGGLTDVYRIGVFDHVFKADVSSLYPSIMLARRVGPKRDRLGVFLQLLQRLTEQRLALKAQLRTLPPDSPEYGHLDSTQNAFKILINSFYGYLGTNGMNFNDEAQANLVTSTGQETLRQIVGLMAAYQGPNPPRVIEIDTDGVLAYREEPSTYEEELEIVRWISAQLPEGLELAHDGRWRAVYCKGEKNYALLGYDGRLRIVGSMRARSREKLILHFTAQALRLLLEERYPELRELYLRTLQRIVERKVTPEEVLLSEQCTMSPEAYREAIKGGTRNRQAVHELMLRSEGRFREGDIIQYYVTGERENVRLFENVEFAYNWDPQRFNVKWMVKRFNDAVRTVFEKALTPESFAALFDPQSFGLVLEVQRNQEVLKEE